MFKRFKPIPFEKRVNKQTKWTMFTKANSGAVVGAPLSIVLNIIITVPVTAWGLDIGLNYFFIALILWPPFYVASVVRQFLIDLAFALYNVDINPSTLLKKLYRKIRNF